MNKQYAIDYFKDKYGVEWEEHENVIFIKEVDNATIEIGGFDNINKCYIDVYSDNAQPDSYGLTSISVMLTIPMLEDLLGIIHLYYLKEDELEVELQHSKDIYNA